MDWMSTWEYLAGQGIMFWSATAAVALGVTLVLTAGHLQWRRLRSRPAEPVFAVRVAKPTTLSDPASAADFQEMIPESENFQKQFPAAFQAIDRQEMGVLMARLRSAGDRLADFHACRRPNPTDLMDSHLKADRQAVEYLFRAGKG